MPPKELPEAQFDRLKKRLQDSIFRDYPNPERQGCPGGAVLQELAELPLDEAVDGDPQWHHITHCSECYREFLAFNNAFRRGVTARRTRLVWAVATAAAVMAIALLFAVRQGVFRFERPQNAELAFQPRLVDLQGRSITRSAGGNQEQKPIILQSEPEELTIRLPFGREAGVYEVQVLKTPNQPLTAKTGRATIQDGATSLIVKLDLSKLANGNYFLGIRQAPGDWIYYPVKID
jgi:hypothetical protein